MPPQEGFSPQRKQYLVARLVAGRCTTEERDEVIALILLSLWGKDELTVFVEKVMHARCQTCPNKDGLGKFLQRHWITLGLLIVGMLVLIIAGLTGTDVSVLTGK